MKRMRKAGSYKTIEIFIKPNGEWRKATGGPDHDEVHRRVWTRDCGDWPYGEHFHPDHEIACKGTGKIMVVDEFMRALVRARVKRNVPFSLRSAYRSPEHNCTIKNAAPLSRHMQGTAFDVSIINQDPFKLMAIMKEEGFPGRGIYIKENFIHFDDKDREFNDTVEELRAAIGYGGMLVKEQPVGLPEQPAQRDVTFMDLVCTWGRKAGWSK